MYPIFSYCLFSHLLCSSFGAGLGWSDCDGRRFPSSSSVPTGFNRSEGVFAELERQRIWSLFRRMGWNQVCSGTGYCDPASMERIRRKNNRKNGAIPSPPETQPPRQQPRRLHPSFPRIHPESPGSSVV